MLYEMVTGHRAFEASSAVSLVGAILERGLRRSLPYWADNSHSAHGHPLGRGPSACQRELRFGERAGPSV